MDEWDQIEANWRVKRVPAFTVTTTDPVLIDRAKRAVQTGRPIKTNFSEWRGRAFVTQVHLSNPIDSLIEGAITFRPTGPPTGFLQSALEGLRRHVTKDTRRAIIEELNHPNCRCVSPEKEKKPVKIRNRFYVASPSVTARSEQDQDNVEKNVAFALSSGDRSGKWTRKTLADAVKHAEWMIGNDPNLDHVAVVQIVRLIRRKKAPIEVEVIK